MQLSISTRPDEDDLVYMSLEVSRDGFAGRSSAYMDMRIIRRFGERILSDYPLNPDEDYILESGKWRLAVGQDRGPNQSFKIHCRQIDRVGHIGVVVELSSPVENDRLESQSTLRVELVAAYSDLERMGKVVAGWDSHLINNINLFD